LAKVFRTNDCENKIYWYENKRLLICKNKGILLIDDIPENTSIKVLTRYKNILYYKLIEGTIERKCSYDGCNKKHHTNGFCNAHFLRSITGMDMTKPIQIKFIEKCTVVGCKNKHEGLGLCKSHLSRKRRKEAWEEIIESKGGCCGECKKEFHFSCYDLHHVDPTKKEYSMAALVVNKTPGKLLNELSKCILLCANCHRIIHYNIKNNING